MTDFKQLPDEIQQEIAAVSRIAGYLWTREWAERNAGNISLNLTEQFQPLAKDLCEDRFVAHVLPKESGGMTLFVTGTGCYLRTLIDAPEQGNVIDLRVMLFRSTPFLFCQWCLKYMKLMVLYCLMYCLVIGTKATYLTT
ncbi:hypothetical protein DMA11_22375, partial [Marinilabiliaceae bacterium JC017]